MFMGSVCSPILRPSKGNGHGPALRDRARLQETLIESARIMVRSGAVEANLRRVMHRRQI
jgi:hypothetical protein